MSLETAFPVINPLTRIKKTSVTAIDHRLTNTILDFEVQNGIIKNDISDHFGIFCVLRTTLKRKNINEGIKQRDITKSSVEKFKEFLSTANLNFITQTLNFNNLLISF